MIRTTASRLFVALCLLGTWLTIGLTAHAAEQIIVTPPQPVVNQPVTFRAVGWDTTACILWDFGDGHIDEDAVDPYTTTHTYTEPGTYTVKAFYQCNAINTPNMITIQVASRATGIIGPAAEAQRQLR